MLELRPLGVAAQQAFFLKRPFETTRWCRLGIALHEAIDNSCIYIQLFALIHFLFVYHDGRLNLDLLCTTSVKVFETYRAP